MIEITKLEIPEYLTKKVVSRLEEPNFSPWRDDIKAAYKYRFMFDNNYGTSVVKDYGSYGADRDRWELAVIKYFGDKSEIMYSTDITADVLGYLTTEEVFETLNRISKLDKDGKDPVDKE